MHINQFIFCLNPDESIYKTKIRRISSNSIWAVSHPYRISKLTLRDEIGKQWFIFPEVNFNQLN